MISFGRTPRRGSRGSPSFDFLRTLHAAFHRGCAHLCPHKWFPRVFPSPRPRHTCNLLCFENSLADRCANVSLWFRAELPDDRWHGAFSPGAVGYLYVSFGKMSTQVLHPNCTVSQVESRKTPTTQKQSAEWWLPGRGAFGGMQSFRSKGIKLVLQDAVFRDLRLPTMTLVNNIVSIRQFAETEAFRGS